MNNNIVSKIAIPCASAIMNAGFQAAISAASGATGAAILNQEHHRYRISIL